MPASESFISVLNSEKKGKVVPFLKSTTVVLIGVAGLTHIFYALFPFPVSGHDAFNHLNWIDEFSQLRGQGIVFPRWLPLSFGGLGSSAFYFYPPLPFYLADILAPLHLSTTVRFQALELVTTLLSICTFYSYMRMVGATRQASLLASLFYAFAPYRFYDAFERSAIGEHVAFAWVPLILLSAEIALRYLKSHVKSDWYAAAALSAFGWGLLLITSIPTAAMMSIVFPLYVLLRAEKKTFQILPSLLVGLSIGLLCISFYLLPVLLLRDQTRISQLWGLYPDSTKWNFNLQELFLSNIPKNAKQVIGITQIIFASALLLLFYFGKKNRTKRDFESDDLPNTSVLHTWLWIGAVALFLQLPIISVPIWDRFPPLSLVQLSWRWNMVLLIIPAIFIAVIWKQRDLSKWIVLSSYAIFCAYFYLRFAFVVLTFPWPPYPTPPDRFGAAEYIPSTVSGSYPEVRLYSRRHMFDKPIEMIDNHSTDSVWLQSRNPVILYYHVRLSRVTHVRIHQFYWPQWRLVSPQGVLPQTIGPAGWIETILPPGDYEVTLQLEPAISEHLGKNISLGGTTLLLGMLLLGVRSTKHKSPDS